MYVAGNYCTHKYHPLEIQIFIFNYFGKIYPKTAQNSHYPSRQYLKNIKVKDLLINQAPVFIWCHMQYPPIHPQTSSRCWSCCHTVQSLFSRHYAPVSLLFPLFLIWQRASLLFKHLWCRRRVGKWAREWAMIRKGRKSGFIYKERYLSAFLNWWAWVPARQQMNSCSPPEDYNVCLDMQKKAAHTVFWELQDVVQKWWVPIEGAEPGE